MNTTSHPKTILSAALACAVLFTAAALHAETAPAAAAEADGPGIPAGAIDCVAVQEGLDILQANNLPAPDGAALRAALLETVLKAGDPHVAFYSAEEWDALRQHAVEPQWDLGFTLIATDGLPKIAAVRADSPAAAAGILPGERIEQVAGADILSGHRLQSVRDKLLAGDAAALAVGLRAEDGTSRTVTIERVRRTTNASLTDAETLPAGMGYLRAAGLYDGAADEIAAAMGQWAGASIIGVILDLRGAGGFAESEIPLIAAHFTPLHKTLYTAASPEGEAVIAAPAARDAATRPLMVLVDESTTAASELLAAIMAGSIKGAMVIGRETSGNPLIRNPQVLSDGRVALLAVRRLTTADGTVYDGSRGVAPDIYISDAALDETVYEPDAPILRKGATPSDEEKEDKDLRDRTRNDTYLRRATDVLLGLQALGYTD